jgi:hypothetical protein
MEPHCTNSTLMVVDLLAVRDDTVTSTVVIWMGASSTTLLVVFRTAFNGARLPHSNKGVVAGDAQSVLVHTSCLGHDALVFVVENVSLTATRA